VGHGQRSVKAIPFPLDVNSTPLQVIKEIPGLNAMDVSKIISGVPYANMNELVQKVALPENILEYLSVNP